MEPFKWTCPFCNHDTIISEKNYDIGNIVFYSDNKYGGRAGQFRFIVCPNPECKEFALYADLCETQYSNGTRYKSKVLETWNLIPSSQAKVIPEYVPKAIRDDYYEACLIRDLSPKASATLSRRCLQGIIRDYWKVSKSRLIDEIEAIKDKIDPFTWDAIDAVRKVGNIGAHMEKDINIIIDVEPKEAALLIELIETLIKDWYITRHERQQRLKSIVEIKEKKDQAKNNSI